MPRVSRALLVSWLIVAVFVGSRVPLMPRAIRHGWHVDMNAHYHPMVMARAFVQEGGRTPYFLFPPWPARPDPEEEWLLYTSWPPLPYYVLAATAVLTRGPHVQIFVARFLTTLGVTLGSWLVSVFSQDDPGRWPGADRPGGGHVQARPVLLRGYAVWQPASMVTRLR